MTPSDTPGPKIGAGANNAQLSFTGTELYPFEVPIGRNAIFKKKFCKIEEEVITFLSQTNSILLFRPRITVQNFIKIESKLRPQECLQTE